MSTGATNKRVKSDDNVQQPGDQKPVATVKGEKGMFVHNYVVNVYSDAPVQTNIHTGSVHFVDTSCREEKVQNLILKKLWGSSC